MIRRILRKIGFLPWLSKRKLARRINAERNREEKLVVELIDPSCFTPLTTDEKLKVDALWGQLLPITSYKEYEFFKYASGFDPRYLSHHIYLPIVARLLNDYKYTKIFDDKGLLGYLTSTKLKFPHCYVRHIESDYYSDDMQQMSLKDAIEVCSCQDELFIKPSKETSGGNGAERLCLKSLSKKDRMARIKLALSERDGDFVVQECLHQHQVMAQFNASSVNSLRITTLLLNGKFTVCSTILRFGKAGSTVDNWGAGGIAAKVEADGRVNPIGHDIHLHEYTRNGDCIFGEAVIKLLPSIIEKIKDAHTHDFALCKFIGWDVAINREGEPVILELNSSQPGVIAEQLVPGPIFGNRTQEVIDYCKTKNFTY